MKKESVNRCRKCGKPVSVISYGIYKNVLVDAEAVVAVADMSGECFIRNEGTKMRGREVDIEEATEVTRLVEYVYRPHARTCGVEK